MGGLSAVSVVGSMDHAFAGRVWMRRFPHGDYEALYKSHSKAPGEVERINTWLATSGSDNRVTARAVFGASVPRQSSGLDVHAKESNHERVKRRAKQRLRWGVKCVGADRLLSLTFRENVTDYDQADAVLTRFLGMCRREWPSAFRFVAVPERQGRGAWHFHLALRGWWNINKIRGFWYRAIGARVTWSDDGRPVLEDTTLTPGSVNITDPKRRGKSARTWGVSSLAAYLAKYVGKTLGEEDLGGKPSYRLTRGLCPAVERYLVRADSFFDVLGVFLGLASGVAASGRSLWQSADRSVLWAAGREGPPRPS